MVLSPEEIKEKAQRDALGTGALQPGAPNEPGVQTYPAGQGPSGPGLTRGPIEQRSPAPPPTGPAAGATPAPGGQPRSGGAGNPMQVLEQAGPEQALKTAEVSARAASKSGPTGGAEANKQKQQINQTMAEQGMDPKAGYQQLKDQISSELERQHQAGEIPKKKYTKLKDRWKNIFNVIPEEDMGLFLMDFGLRMMAHSGQGEALGTSIGMAGQGALGGVQARQQAEQEGALKRDQMAHERAVDVAALGRRQPRGADTINTEQGVLVWNETKGTYEELKSPSGETYKPSSLATRAPVDKWKIDQYLRVFPDMGEEEATRRVLGGVTPEAVRQDAERAWAAFMRDADAYITIGGESKRRREVEPGDKQRFMQQTLESFGFGKRQGEGALQQPGERIVRKPPNWTQEEWDEYNELYDRYRQ